MKRSIIVLSLLIGLSSYSLAAVNVFEMDVAGFDAAVSGPLNTINFDDMAPGTFLYPGINVQGVTFHAPGAPLIVVKGADTYTPGGFVVPHTTIPIADTTLNVLVSTSGENILSPGGVVLGSGPNPGLEKDDIELVFDVPVLAFGFDLLTQSCDGHSLTDISVFDDAGSLLYTGNVPISGVYPQDAAGPGGTDFWGIVSSAADIKKILITETDGGANNPDANIGYDSLRYGVPEPCTLVLLGLGGLVLRRKR